MSWTEERVEVLKKLWAEGHSASQIAKQLGGVTRNAVIGKVHRLGLSGRATPSRPVKRPPRLARPKPRIQQTGTAPVAAEPNFEETRVRPSDQQAGGTEQAVGDLLIIDRLEKTKKAKVFLVTLEVLRVVDRGYPAHRLSIPHCQEVLHGGKVMERMSPEAKQLFQLSPQWGDPHRVILVDLPGQFKELLLLAARGNRFDVNL